MPEPFPSLLNKQIEDAYRNKMTQYDYNYNNTNFRINFKTMMRENFTTNKANKLMRMINGAVSEKDFGDGDLSSKILYIDEDEGNSEIFILDLKNADKFAQHVDSNPPEADKVPDYVSCKKIVGSKGSNEFNHVKKLFDRTMVGMYTYIVIERLENPRTRYYYEKNLKRIAYENNENPNRMTLQLFHGTKDTSPDLIYNGRDKSFDLKYSRGGIWGEGVYFSTKASYSQGYAHLLNNACQMFLADVIIGNSFNYGGRGYRQLIKSPEIVVGEPKRYYSGRAITRGSEI